MDPTASATPEVTPAGLFARCLLGLIAFYRYFLSPLVGTQCRFAPSCSLYAQKAVILHGGIKGMGLALRRILRCHPWSPGGIDEVPGDRTPPHSRPRNTGI